MAFTSRRGRPRAHRLPADPGTPELRLKHALGLTREPLDHCLEKRLITADQHRAGVHFRWLYTLRYGLPTVRALDLSALPGAPRATAEDDPWRQGREVEFREAARVLNNSGCLRAVLAVCVMQHAPACLAPVTALRRNPAAEQELSALQTGLQHLVSLWFRPNPAAH